MELGRANEPVSTGTECGGKLLLYYCFQWIKYIQRSNETLGGWLQQPWFVSNGADSGAARAKWPKKSPPSTLLHNDQGMYGPLIDRRVVVGPNGQLDPGLTSFKAREDSFISNPVSTGRTFSNLTIGLGTVRPPRLGSLPPKPGSLLPLSSR